MNGRMHQLNGTNACTILDDSYNANPASMAAALNTLRQMPGRRIAVLGDMAELGAETVRLHAEVDVSEIELVIAVGEQIRVLATLQADICPVNDAEQALSMLRDLQLGRNDVLLVKGSRCMHMERIVNGLTGGGDAV